MRETAQSLSPRAWLAIGAAAAWVLLTEHVGYAAGAPLEFLVLDTVFGLLFVVAGAIAWERRPESPTGRLLVLSGALWSLGSWNPAQVPVMWAVAFAFEGYYDVALAYLALTFPGGRLSGPSRAAFAVLASAFVVRSMGRLLLQDPPRTYPELFADGPTNPFAVLESRAAFEAVESLTSAVVAVACVAIAWLVVRRLLSTPALARAVVQPVLVASVVAMSFAAFDAAETAWTTLTGSPLIVVTEPWATVVGWALPAARCLVPLGFLVGTLRLRSAGGPLRAVATRLRDDATPEEVDTALRAYIENDALADQLTAQLAELRASRARLVTAADDERRRIERTLHDGAQQHLTGVSIRLDDARRHVGDSQEVERRLDETAAELADAIHELRELARGIHPAILTDEGLGPALATLARRSTVPVEVDLDIPGRLPAPTEVTIYYLVAEALTNVARSAKATAARVRVARKEDVVHVAVVDDGVGGADARRGSGISGLADRVRALDGRFSVQSPEGGGTTLEAWLPCA